MAESPKLKPVSIVRYRGDTHEVFDDPVAVETIATLFVNDIEVATLLCSPGHIDALAVGFLIGEGVLTGRDQLIGSVYDRGKGIARVTVTDEVDLSAFTDGRKGTLTSGCGKGQTYNFVRNASKMETLPPGPTLSAKAISEKIKTFIHASETYAATGGVHSAMVWDGNGLGIFGEDLGRHNAVDKVYGRCMLEGIETAGRILLTSGRMSSEVVLKSARARVPIVISRNAPTTFSVQLAKTLDLTLVGFVRGDRMNVYTAPERIVP